MEPIRIRALAAGDMTDAAGLLTQLNQETPAALIEERLRTILADHPHYELYGAFVGDRLAGVVGAWVATKIWCGRYLEIDNLVVDAGQRSLGIGGLLMQHLETLARERGCTIIALDSYAANRSSHRLYHRLGFEIWSFHFIKPIGDWKGDA